MARRPGLPCHPRRYISGKAVVELIFCMAKDGLTSCRSATLVSLRQMRS